MNAYHYRSRVAGLSLALTTGLVIPSYSHAASEGAILEEIVITAERREASAQRTALAISVLGGDELASEGIQSMRDILDSVPGLDLTQSTPSSNISLRGLGAGGGTNYTDAVVAFNIGGVPIARQYATVGAFYDLDRIEVLKGPQGTLYGRNATVGAINLVPRRPTQQFEGDMNLTIGNYNTLNLSGGVSLPMTDTLSARLAFATNGHDGYLSNGYNDANNHAARLSVLVEPSSDVSLLLWADYYQDRSRGPSSVNRYPIPGQEWQFPNNPWFAYAPLGCGDPSICPTWGDSAGTNIHAAFDGQSVVGSDGFFNVKQMIYAAQLDWQLGPATLTVLPAVVNTDNHFLSYSTGFNFKNDTKARQQSLEARLASNGEGKLRWLIGSIYYHEAQDATQQNFEPNGYQIIRSPNLDDKSWAVFTDNTYSLTERFRVTAGLRYTKETKEQDGFTLLEFPTFTAGTCPAPGVFAAGPTTAFGNSYPLGYCQVPNGGSADFTNTTWKVGVEFDVVADSLLYGNVRTGHKAGGFFPGLPPNTYKPEELTAYELGSKNRFFNNRLQANVEVFYWDYKDQQIGLLSNINPAGQSTRPLNIPGYAEGVELSTDWLATDNDRVGLVMLYEKGEYDIYPATANAAGVVTGGLANFARVNMPEWTGTLTYDHTFNFGSGAQLVPGAKIHYESESVLRPVAAPTLGDIRPAFHTLDLNLTFVAKDEQWRLTAYMDNATNEAVAGTGTSGTVGAPIWYRPASNPTTTNATPVRYAAIDPPRTWGVRFSAKF